MLLKHIWLYENIVQRVSISACARKSLAAWGNTVKWNCIFRVDFGAQFLSSSFPYTYMLLNQYSIWPIFHIRNINFWHFSIGMIDKHLSIRAEIPFGGFMLHTMRSNAHLFITCDGWKKNFFPQFSSLGIWLLIFIWLENFAFVRW